MTEGEELRLALVGAYRGYVRESLRSRGIEPPPDLEDALDRGAAWLGEELHDLLALPFPEQRRGPLELFQEAMRFPTEVLARAGVEPVERDEGAARALPGDLYDLAPASSAAIGEEVWVAHVRWGTAKARALAGPDEPRQRGG